MDLMVRGNDIAITDGLREFAVARAAKLDRLLDRVVDAKLELRSVHQRQGGTTITAQLTVQTGRQLLRAEESDRDAERAIDLVIAKMDRQIRRGKDRRSSRKQPREVVVTDQVPSLPGADDFGDDENLTLVRTKRFAVKPMDPEEAIEQMELLGHDFFLFDNREEGQMNVVYRRKDGTYGLLCPQRG